MRALRVSTEDDAIAGLVVAGSGHEPVPAGRAGEADVHFRWARADAPWPAADALFGMPQPEEAVVSVIGDGDDLAEKLRARGLRVESSARLDAEGLRRGAVVVAPAAGGTALPAFAPSVLAARRVLVTHVCSPTFGFRVGIDHCGGVSDDDLADLAESVIRHWDGFRRMRVHGAVAAERHRASRALAELAFDLENAG